MADDNARCSATLWRLYKSGLVDNEYRDVVLIFFACLGSSGIHFKRTPTSNNDLSVLKIRVNGKVPSELVQMLGGAAISLPGGDMYEALQRRTIDGVITSWSAYAPYRLQEVTNYHIEFPMGASASMFFMSRKKFESLPPDAQKALEQHGGDAQSRSMGAFFASQGDGVRKKIEGDAERQIVKITPEQHKTREEKAASVLAIWPKAFLTARSSSKPTANCTQAQSRRLAIMRRNDGRILTSHVGSLPRPVDLIRLLQARQFSESGHAEAEFFAACARSVNKVVAHQREIGLDVINDGEHTKISFSSYAN